MSPLETLGLPDDASLDELKIAWRRLAKIHHPDHGGDSGRFIELRKAYVQALESAMKRKLCPVCKGQGRTYVNHGFASVSLTCTSCRGSGNG